MIGPLQHAHKSISAEPILLQLLAEAHKDGSTQLEMVDGRHTSDLASALGMRAATASAACSPRPVHRRPSSPASPGVLVMKVVGFLAGSPASDSQP